MVNFSILATRLACEVSMSSKFGPIRTRLKIFFSFNYCKWGERHFHAFRVIQLEECDFVLHSLGGREAIESSSVETGLREWDT